MSVKVSVCIPVYGVEKYIERCARSLFEQTMRDGLELVFVNDCTPDKSIEILEQVLSEYPHRKALTKIINLPDNGGVGRARRIAIENCTGEYIIHCDPDDWVELDMYEKMYLTAKENNADMVYCDYIREMPDGIYAYGSGGNSVSPIELQKEILRRDAGGFLWNKMYKRCIAGEDYSVICTDDITLYEDVLRNCCMLLRCETGIHLQEALYHYLIRQTSITRNPDKKQRENTFSVAVQLSKIVQSPQQIEALTTRQRLGLLSALGTGQLTAKSWHSTWKKAKTGMWKDKHFSFKTKCIFYLGCINYPLASYIYKKLKGIS